jgi:hypothetical protein
MTVEELKSGIQDKNPQVRTAAWCAAGELGAAAVAPLAELTHTEDREVARAAERGLWTVVRHAGRPGADAEREAVNEALLALLAEGTPDALRREVLWMVSEIAGDGAVPALAALLENAPLREDARMALQRIPGDASLAALQIALASASEDFKASLAQGLRARGAEVDGVPCLKLVPTRETEVEV